MAVIKVVIDMELKDLIPGYLKNRRRDIEELKRCHQVQDFESCRSMGHKMKGSGGGYGFDRITEIGFQLEAVAHAEDGDKVYEQIQQLQEYLDSISITYAE